MSVAGLEIFNRNLRKVMATERFQRATPGERVRLGVRLLRSNYGLGRMAGVGPVDELPTPPSKQTEASDASHS